MKEETEELGEKPLHNPPNRNNLLVTKLDHKNNKKTL